MMVISLLTACSNNNDTSESADAGNNQATYDQNEEASTGEMKMEMEMRSNSDEAADDADVEQAADSSTDLSNAIERKIIYNAQLRVEVKNYSQALNDIQTEVNKTGGYIVQSQTYGGSSEELQEGMIKVRIPQEQFDQFLAIVEEGSVKVIQRDINGKDVTEEYVDLESRLTSKRVVEERLLSFMEAAEETEDLLKISNDLAEVQAEIEEITGRMNYLQNRANLATVTIHIHENRVTIPNVNENELNTWEKTKQQFMESINFLLLTASGLFIFIGGNLPIIILLTIIGLITYTIYKKKKQSE
ncbi:major membrane immunogen (membrane-anchored lipoprotein) [Aquibacillus albus]|uniref:Major membrane immunogen (Membrane-anchored lipoprotein) n=2 Tax=Aquibacillus albus TaxID=1168171 RepID=A0ABS2MZ33_9BACI|nr:major membrane immunogen (membrane-anchored lipoprotein) [Aquibacillus albus]